MLLEGDLPKFKRLANAYNSEVQRVFGLLQRPDVTPPGFIIVKNFWHFAVPLEDIIQDDLGETVDLGLNPSTVLDPSHRPVEGDDKITNQTTKWQYQNLFAQYMRSRNILKTSCDKIVASISQNRLKLLEYAGHHKKTLGLTPLDTPNDCNNLLQ